MHQDVSLWLFRIVRFVPPGSPIHSDQNTCNTRIRRRSSLL